MSFRLSFAFVYLTVLASSCGLEESSHALPNKDGFPLIHPAGNSIMPEHMKLEASSYLLLATSGDFYLIFRKLISLRYPQYMWHFAQCNAHAVDAIMSLELYINSDPYLLFATAK